MACVRRAASLCYVRIMYTFVCVYVQSSYSVRGRIVLFLTEMFENLKYHCNIRVSILYTCRIKNDTAVGRLCEGKKTNFSTSKARFIFLSFLRQTTNIHIKRNILV